MADVADRRQVDAGWLRRHSPILTGILVTVGPFVLLITLWQMVASWVAAPGMVPAPAGVAAEGLNLARQGVLLDFVGHSLRTMILASVLAVGAGFVLGLLIASSDIATKILYPPINFLAATSEIAWLPMMLIWFGFSRKTVLAVVIYTIIFPVIFNTLVGLRSVPHVYSAAIATMGGSRWRILRDALMPGALASIMTGIRLGIAYGWRTLIAAEMIVGISGVGFMIFRAQTAGDVERIVLGMVVIGALWLTIDRQFLKPIEKATIERWGTSA